MYGVDGVEDERNQGGNELSFTASHNAVEFSADMDIIPLALPYRRKSAYLPLALISPTPPWNTAHLSLLSTDDYQTLGHALHTLIPSLFPSRRDPILAAAILHGARVPLHATLDDLMRECAYADGWVAVVGVML
jgi:hypothetical protein